jgi:predicted membrane-bound spermidine synthase
MTGKLYSDPPARLLSFTIGVLSLGTETLWVRTFSFLGRSTPQALSIVLGVYLFGIAFGALLGARFCRAESRASLATILATSLLSGSIVILGSPFVVAAIPHLPQGVRFSRAMGPATMSCLLAFVAAFIFSVCFPICHHLGTKTESGLVGKGMSRVYASNIAGSVIGPLLVNFGLLQFATTQLSFAILGVVGVCAGACLVALSVPRRGLQIACVLGFLFGAASVFASAGSVDSADASNWLITSLSSIPDDIRRVVETRQGIVVSYPYTKIGDAIYGGNVYDGRSNLDVHINSNGINRVLVLAALKTRPKRVLVIGLSVGTWNYLITGFPGVDLIDVVEINPGYLQMIEDDYPKQSVALNDSRVRLHIGDGRKFLMNHPRAKYDLVVMNTTFHWRAYTSLLLSKEFMMLVHSRMAPRSLLTFNTTSSIDALYTAATVFRHAYAYDNFAICADFDWRDALDEPIAAEELMHVRPQGDMLFTMDDGELVKSFLSRDHVSDLAQAITIAGRAPELITDRNLISEFKYGLWRSLIGKEQAERWE